MEGTVFVTGASGFVGRQVCRRLASAGLRVKALIHDRQLDPDLAARVETIRGDLLDPDSYRESLIDCRYVIHLGGDASYANGGHYYVANTDATRILIDTVSLACRRLKRFVFMSTSGAVERSRSDRCDGPVTEVSPPFPSTDYGRSKLEAEHHVENSPLPWVILRPAMVVGPGMRRQSHVRVFVRASVNRALVSLFDFPGRVCVLNISDLLDATLLVMDDDRATGGTYFVAGSTVALGEIFRKANPRRARIGITWMRPLFRLFFGFLPFKVKGLLFDAFWVSDEQLRRLGWEPRVSVDASIEALVRAERREQGGLPPGGEGWSLVTGAGSGLGRACAIELAGSGRKLLLVDKDEEALQGVLTDYEPVKRVPCDLSDEYDLAALLRSDAWSEEGVDELYACAGIGARGSVLSLSDEVHSRVLAVNVMSRIALIRHAIAEMLNRGVAGRVVIVSSSTAFQPVPYMALYGATNAALLSFGQALWAELRDTPIRILTVCPGGMRTRFQESAGVKVLPGERLAEPADVAKWILKTLDKDRCVACYGLRSRAMSLAARILPRKLQARAWAKMMSRLR